MKKKLPKAIVRTNDEVRAVGAMGRQEAVLTGADDVPAADAAARVSGPADNVIEKPSPPPNAEADIARRRSLALAIVNRHAAFSAVGGIIPIPLANVASVTAIIVRMVKALSKYYGVPFERDRARTIVVSLVAGTMPIGLASVTTSTLLYIVPSNAVVGLAVSSVTAAACTRSIGLIFIEHFENGSTLVDVAAAGR